MGPGAGVRVSLTDASPDLADGFAVAVFSDGETGSLSPGGSL